MQPDTIIPDLSNPQSWNRFSYVYNNPILHNDPTGHCIAICTVIALIGIAVILNEIPSDVPQDNPANQGDPNRMLFGLTLTIGAPEISGMIGEGLMGVGQLLNSPRIFSAGVSAYNAANAAATVSANATNSNSTKSLSSSRQKTTAIQTYYPPKNGFSEDPKTITLTKGDLIGRRGGLDGAEYGAIPGQPPFTLSLPPGKEKMAEDIYKVVKPITGVQSGPTVSWFGQPGGGTQYYFGGAIRQTLRQLLEDGFIVPTKK